MLYSFSVVRLVVDAITRISKAVDVAKWEENRPEIYKSPGIIS